MCSSDLSHTKPGSLLKSQIPIRTWADWDDAVPGFVEIDLVGHEGGNAAGEHCFTLTVTDIATGWTENHTVPNKARKWVIAALEEIADIMPFPILLAMSDIHTEFAGARSSLLDFDRSSRCADFLRVECVGGRVPHLGRGPC